MILPDIQSLTDIQLLRESVDLECKLALGRNGQGALPEDFWPTYSAFANTGGGVVVLGLRENNGAFSVEGVTNIAKVRTDLFNSLQNPQKISVNLLVDADVTELALPEGNLLVIRIPRADRKQRPVYLRGNPLGNTYIRRNEGDRRLLEEDVKRMLAEQLEDSRDDRILPGYGQADLCLETLRSYRQVFANRDPGHPWSTLDDESFLSRIGGWRQDRETGENGLTLAGLLMFGWMSSIQEALPNYMLDYQERPEAKIERRWMDRVTLDGKWSGNLYDFYRKVYLKLTEDLKVPFSLEQGERKDETPVHVALREALANVLVHADYSERASVLVVKRPDMFGFRNPGLMRIPPEIAIRGGEHDCRNRTLHKMFRFVGVGEQAGSGIPKIYDGWAEQHWRPPALYERIEPYNQTLLELRMVDLLPQALSTRPQTARTTASAPEPTWPVRQTIWPAGTSRSMGPATLGIRRPRKDSATDTLVLAWRLGYISSSGLPSMSSINELRSRSAILRSATTSPLRMMVAVSQRSKTSDMRWVIYRSDLPEAFTARRAVNTRPIS